ncbi:MAG TPA: hypothetical protein VGJ57_08755 [Nitrospirales bacterium]|jgi:hypothetical protein
MTWLFPIQLHTEFLPYLLGVLGLLMTWELHDIELRAGRIKPRAARTIRKWVKSHGGIRMYIIATPIDTNTCEICRQARGKVFSSAQRNKKGFRPMATLCVNPAGCRCELVGLIGNWPEAERLSKTLRESEEPPTLSEVEMIQLASSAGSLPGGPDRLGLYLLEALQSEGTNPNFSMSRYRSLICQALDGTQHPYIVPAYLRLSDLLERGSNLSAALSVVDEFLTVAKTGLGPHAPTRLQTKVMTIRRWRLLKRLKSQ